MLTTLVLSQPCIASQVVAYTTATKSAQLSTQTTAITISCTTAAYVRVGDTGVVATAATGAYVGANQPTVFEVPPSSFVSVLQVSSGGNAYITEWRT
jgi:hypothetical protein